MKSPDRWLNRWLHPILFGAWTFILIYLVVTQTYTAFLRPEFGILLVIAHFIAMGFMLTSITRDRKPELDFSSVLRVLVLLVPVVYMMTIPDTMLGYQAFKSRYVGHATLNQQDTTLQASMQEDTELEAQRLSGDQNNPVSQTLPQERTILELILKPGRYRGRQVSFSGMFLRDDHLKEYFGGVNTAVYRFIISCCAADAQPLAVAVELDQAVAFTKDQWVLVEGIFDQIDINGKSAPIVRKAVLKSIEAPLFPYLY
ncbi:MAG: TIGR03943 family protein [Pseudomonadota bacterium]